MRKNFIIPVGRLTKFMAVAALVLLTAAQAMAQITVTATAGTLGPTNYTQLRLAFNAINAGTHQGAVTISVTASTAETAVAQLNSGTTFPASYTSVLIKPAAATAPTIQGAVGGNGLIYLRGASNVTIDGSNTAGGTSRDLTIRNTTGTGGSCVVRFGSASAIAGCDNNTVKNCNISMSGPTIGIAISSGSGVTLFQLGEAPHSNNTIQNNVVTNCQTAMYAYGPAALDVNWNINGNDFNTLGFSGATIYNTTGTNIVNNTINNVNINGATSTSGITLSWGTSNMTIARNKISNINNSVANGAYGIYSDIPVATSANINIYNNFVLNVTCPPAAAIAADNGHGIYTDIGTGFNIHHNTVQLSTNSSATSTSGCITYDPFAALGGIPAGGVNMRNNIMSNIQTIGNRYGLYSTGTAAMFSVIDYNDYSATSGNLGFIGGINRTTIAQIQAGFGGNLNSITTAPTFVAPGADLHLQGVLANAPLIAGQAILAAPAIINDIDNELRHNVTPTIGAHEILNKITYTNLANTCSDGTITLNPVTIESKLGATITGANLPRIYFRKGAGPWFSNPGTLISGTANNSQWSFTITPGTMGGVTFGDVISYYVIAQTSAGPSLVFSNPLAGLAATDVNTVTSHPTTPNTYTVNVVHVTGLTTSQAVCFSPAVQVVPFAYTGIIGAPNQYTLTWTPVGPTDVPVFSALSSPVNVSVPGGTAAATYTGSFTVRNNTTTCSRVYTLTLTINPAPSPIVGPTNICQGTSTVMTSTPGGGAWSSSNTSVGTIGAISGVAGGVGVGTTTIVYTLPTGCTRSMTMAVAAPPGVISGSTPICPNTTLTLTNPSTGGTWSSAPAVIASIDPATGVVTGNATGTATISYNVAGCLPATTVVSVLPTPNPITGTMYACTGSSTTLSTTSSGGTWISSTPAVGSVGSTTGVVSGITAGSTVITYKFTSSGCFTTNTVNIFPTPGAITGGPLICQGLTITLSNTLTGGSWSSTLPGVISVISSTGDATANSPTGTARISYIMPTGCFATKVLTVSTAPTAITGGSHIMCSGTTLTLTNGTSGGTWSTSNPSVATVSPTGLVSAIAGGVVNIAYVTTSCNAATYTITVNQTPPPITGGITLCNGGSSTTINNATTGGTWTMTSAPTATITSLGTVGGLATANINGLVTGGTYAVTYTVPNGCFVIAPIIVDTLPAPITGADSVCMGATANVFTASTGGVWSSSNTGIATIGATTGLVTGVNYGLVTISYAAVSGCARTKLFKVRTPLPAGVTITRTPAMDTLCSGVPVTFTAHAVNGGATPGFIWQLFGTDILGATNDTYTYVPTHGDVISVFMQYSTDVCSFPSPAYANIPLNIYPNVIPTIVISTTMPSLNASFMGQVYTFFAEVTSGGGAATYQWFVDGEPVPGATNSSYAHAVYNNDTIFCRVNGNPPCELGSIGNSNKIIIQGDYLSVDGVAGVGGNLALFPNPNNGTFTLRGTLNSKAATYDVVNVIGQVVSKGQVETKNGSVDQVISVGKGLSAGTYMLRINSETDNKVFHFVVAD